MLMRVIVSRPAHRPSETQERRRAWGLREGLWQRAALCHNGGGGELGRGRYSGECIS